MKLLRAGLCLAAFACAMSAQDDVAFQKWMKTIGGQMGALRKMESKTGPEAAESAAKLSAVFGDMGAFWSSRNAEDAVKLSSEGKAAADDLAAAAKAGDAEKANAAFKTIGGTCKGCHDAHREKVGENGYKIK